VQAADPQREKSDAPLEIPFIGAVPHVRGIAHETFDQKDGERAHGQTEVEDQRQELLSVISATQGWAQNRGQQNTGAERRHRVDRGALWECF
jgi:hypothetical protein